SFRYQLLRRGTEARQLARHPADDFIGGHALASLGDDRQRVIDRSRDAAADGFAQDLELGCELAHDASGVPAMRAAVRRSINAVQMRSKSLPSNRTAARSLSTGLMPSCARPLAVIDSGAMAALI